MAGLAECVPESFDLFEKESIVNQPKETPIEVNRATSLDPGSPDDCRRVLDRIPASVAIITATHEGSPVGVAIGSFGSVSLGPPLVGFYIAATSTTWPLIATSGGFCASVLGAHQEEVCRLFATRGADKFGTTGWSRSRAGRPVIDGAAAWIDCDLESVTPTGDHHHVVGRITGMNNTDSSPLVFLGGRYGQLIELDGAAEEWD